MSKGWRRLVAISCTLLLAGSVFLILGVTVWAQEQPTEQPAETTQTPAQTEQTSQGDGLVIDYWEPQVGTRTVYLTEDMNDIHGDLWGTMTLGYWDDATLYAGENPQIPINFASSYYRSVEAISNMNPVYFGLEGPWYFNMTTPFKHIETVVGIHEAPDASQFPQATYAISYLFIASGGHRIEGYEYCSNDATQKKWLEWGYTIQYTVMGDVYPTKEVITYKNPMDKKTLEPITKVTFPLAVGDSGSISPEYGDTGIEASNAGMFEVVAEGKITVPAGTFDALLIEYDMTPSAEFSATELQYAWWVSGVGVVAAAQSLPNELGPLFEEATDLVVLEEQTGAAAAQR